MREAVVAQVECVEMLEIADARREVFEVVVGEDEGFQVGLFPEGVGELAEVLLPEIEGGRGRSR